MSYSSRGSDDAWYDTAQICLNGHVISPYAGSHPQRQEKFCSQCGALTLMQCPYCNTAIRGRYHMPHVIGNPSNYSAPAFCYNCGKAYPWTEQSLKVAQEYAEELEELSPEDRALLIKSIPELAHDTPQTPLAASRFKRVMSKVAPAAYEIMIKVVTDFASEAAKKMILGG